MSPGDFVILHLHGPTEKFWGLLLELSPLGVILRGLNVGSFDDWMAQAHGEEETIGLSTMFLPMQRVERLFLDEQVGVVESYSQRFERRVGVSLEEYLGLPRRSGEIPS